MLLGSAILAITITTVFTTGLIAGSFGLVKYSFRKTQKEYQALANHFGIINLEVPRTNFNPLKKEFPYLKGELFDRIFCLYMEQKRRDDATYNITYFIISLENPGDKKLTIKKESRLTRFKKARGQTVEHELRLEPFDKLYLLETEDGRFLDSTFDDDLIDLFIRAYPHLKGTFELRDNQLIYTEYLLMNSVRERVRIQKLIELGYFLADRLEVAIRY